MYDEKPTEPGERDYYFDLGLSEKTTIEEVRKAWAVLVLKHHPDKKAPGKATDASEFIQVCHTSFSFPFRAQADKRMATGSRRLRFPSRVR